MNTNIELSDEQLIVMVAGGDPLAFEEIDRRWRKLLVGLISSKLGGNVALADEIAQTVLVKAWERSGQFNEACGLFRSWIKRMAVNAIVDHKRHNGRKKRGGGIAAVEIVDDCFQGDDDAVVEEYVDLGRLSELIQTLPCRERKAARAMLRGESASATSESSELTRSQIIRARNAAIERMRDSICISDDGCVKVNNVDAALEMIQQQLFHDLPSKKETKRQRKSARKQMIGKVPKREVQLALF